MARVWRTELRFLGFASAGCGAVDGGSIGFATAKGAVVGGSIGQFLIENIRA